MQDDEDDEEEVGVGLKYQNTSKRVLQAIALLDGRCSLLLWSFELRSDVIHLSPKFTEHVKKGRSQKNETIEI